MREKVGVLILAVGVGGLLGLAVFALVRSHNLTLQLSVFFGVCVLVGILCATWSDG